jgi:subtilase family serine protease
MSNARKMRLVAVAAVVAATVALVTPSALARTPLAGHPQPILRTVPCDKIQPGRASCSLIVNLTATLMNRPGSTPMGYGPADLQSAYGLTHAALTRGTGQTVAVVMPYTDPTAEADLAVYRAQYGLPSCTTGNGCFQRLNEKGQPAPLPRHSAGWAEVTSNTLDMVSAICPNCGIDLVEANDNFFKNFDLAVRTARALASVVDVAWYAPERRFMDEPKYTSPYNGPGGFVVATGGHDGYTTVAQYPADLPTVTAVGGTTLTRSGNARGWTETAWGSTVEQEGAGSACSRLFPKPAWQIDKGCPMRMDSDVSIEEDPNPGVATYYTDKGPGWVVDSASGAGLISGVVGLAQNGATIGHDYPYTHGSLHDIVGGNNDISNQGCLAGETPKYFCNGLRGYDGPTGLGTPNGYSSF